MTPAPPEPPSESRWQRLWHGLVARLRHRPMMTLGLVAVAAISLTDHYSYVPGWGAWLLLMLSLVYALYQRHWWSWLPMGGMLFVCVHGWRLTQTYEHPLRQHLLTLPDRYHLAQVTGRLYPWTEGAELDDATAIGDLMEVRLDNQKPFKNVRVRVILPEGFHLEKPGVYEITGRITLPSPPMNPGQINPVDFSLRNGWVAWLRADDIQLKKQESWAPVFHLLHWAESSRQRVMADLSLGIEDRPQDTAVLLAMALGVSDAAGDDVEDAFRDSGTLHIFAVSGLHVVMLAWVLSVALRSLGCGQSRVNLFIIFVVFAYAFITGWRPSAARAAFMIAIVLGAVRWNLRADVHNSLGLALLVLLLWDSHQMFTPGFQLSFLVLWAIALMAGFMSRPLQPWVDLDSFLPPSLASWYHWLGRRLRGLVAGLACTSVAAWIGSFPLTVGHFNSFTPVGIIANLVLVPVSEWSIGLSCASIVFARCGLSSVQMFINWVNVWLARFMVVSAVWFASLPASNVALDLSVEESPPPMEMNVFHLQGGASAGHLRAGDHHWLLDTGNVRPWRRVVRPFLRHQGINHLEGVLLTHRDTSHAGAASLAVQTGVSRLITSIHEPWSLDPGITFFDELSRRVKLDGPLWHRHEAGQVIDLGPSMTAQVLYPGPSDLHDTADSRSLVLMIQMGAVRVLWLGDAGFITEKRLLERHWDVRCDVLVHGCHSADPGGLTELLLAAQPRVIISESDSIFSEVKTPQSIQSYCQRHGIHRFVLDVTGSVRIGVSQSGAVLKTHRSGEEVILPVKLR